VHPGCCLVVCSVYTLFSAFRMHVGYAFAPQVSL
jgi:hypothetical protein